MKVSPQLAWSVGAGNCPLTNRTLVFTPSGAINPRATVKSYRRMTPVNGGLV